MALYLVECQHYVQSFRASLYQLGRCRQHDKKQGNQPTESRSGAQWELRSCEEQVVPGFFDSHPASSRYLKDQDMVRFNVAFPDVQQSLM